MGRKGKSVVLLIQGREEGYVEFLNLRKVPLRERAYLDETLDNSRAVDPDQPGPSKAATRSHAVDPAAFALMEELRDIVLTDRELSDKGAKAYVSAVRAYTKHEASYIFQLKDLDLFGLGVAFGCLRLPKMPEIRAWKDRLQKVKTMIQRIEEKGDPQAVLPEVPGDGISWQDRELDWNTYAFTSKPREAARLEALKAQDPETIAAEREKAAQIRRANAERASAWSVQKDRKDKRELRREKKDRKKDWEARVEKAQAFGGVRTHDAKEEDGAVDDFADDYKELRLQAKSKKLDRQAGAEWKAPTAAVKAGMFDDLS